MGEKSVLKRQFTVPGFILWSLLFGSSLACRNAGLNDMLTDVGFIASISMCGWTLGFLADRSFRTGICTMGIGLVVAMLLLLLK